MCPRCSAGVHFAFYGACHGFQLYYDLIHSSGPEGGSWQV